MIVEVDAQVVNCDRKAAQLNKKQSFHGDSLIVYIYLKAIILGLAFL